jgi:hypothetical protein
MTQHGEMIKLKKFAAEYQEDHQTTTNSHFMTKYGRGSVYTKQDPMNGQGSLTNFRSTQYT